MIITDKFFALVRLGVGGTEEADRKLAVSEKEWPVLLQMAKKQSLLGILWDGMQMVGEESCPPRRVLMQWMAQIDEQEERNMSINRRCREITEALASVGLDACILKGQGIAALYPNPLHRQAGDIDVWCKLHGSDPHEGVNGNVKKILQRLAKLPEGRVGKAVYHHAEWTHPDVEVEVHYRPQQLNHPIVNKRFLKWCDDQWPQMEEVDGYYRPSARFNVVYMLEHLYHHLLFEGVGLRQVCDYYVLLQNHEVEDKDEVQRIIKSLNMMRFAKGLMWVMGEVFHLESERMIAKPDEDEGRFILNEILQAGNFGKFDSRIDHARMSSTAGKFFVRTKHRWRFVTRYPSEILWDWPFRLYHWFWRQLYT